MDWLLVVVINVIESDVFLGIFFLKIGVKFHFELLNVSHVTVSVFSLIFIYMFISLFNFLMNILLIYLIHTIKNRRYSKKNVSVISYVSINNLSHMF